MYSTNWTFCIESDKFDHSSRLLWFYCLLWNYMHTRAHTHIHTHTHTHTHTHIHTHTHTHTHTRMHTDTQTQSQTPRSHTHACMHAHTHIHKSYTLILYLVLSLLMYSEQCMLIHWLLLPIAELTHPHPLTVFAYCRAWHTHIHWSSCWKRGKHRRKWCRW